MGHFLPLFEKGSRVLFPYVLYFFGARFAPIAPLFFCPTFFIVVYLLFFSSIIKRKIVNTQEFPSKSNKKKICGGICPHRIQLRKQQRGSGLACDLKAHKLVCTGELNCSSGEFATMNVLDEMKIDYLYNTSFWGVRDKKLLRWDFIISPAMNPKVIEFDGECHFFAIRYGGITEQEAQENLAGSKRRDAIKDDYYVANSIPILRIAFYNKDNIEKLISEFVI